jgi:hypothetical protein
MATKTKTKASYQGDPGDEHVEKMTTVKETPKLKTNKWEIKDRTYLLKNGSSPVTLTLGCNQIFWFDEEKGYERELKYTRNQKTPFVDEFKGDARLEHVTFDDGVLTVPRNNQTLQKLLSLYHPKLNKVYYEFNAVKEAKDDLVDLNTEVDALIAARTLDIDMTEAIMRVELGSEVSKMSSKELKRDLLLYAKQNPVLFLDLLKDDNIQLRNFGIKATEMNIINLSGDQRTFFWTSNNRKLMNVPFDEHPYSALASWFKTDEGMEIYSNIEKQLK